MVILETSTLVVILVGLWAGGRFGIEDVSGRNIAKPKTLNHRTSRFGCNAARVQRGQSPEALNIQLLVRLGFEYKGLRFC